MSITQSSIEPESSHITLILLFLHWLLIHHKSDFFTESLDIEVIITRPIFSIKAQITIYLRHINSYKARKKTLLTEQTPLRPD